MPFLCFYNVFHYQPCLLATPISTSIYYPPTAYRPRCRFEYLWPLIRLLSWRLNYYATREGFWIQPNWLQIANKRCHFRTIVHPTAQIRNSRPEYKLAATIRELQLGVNDALLPVLLEVLIQSEPFSCNCLNCFGLEMSAVTFEQRSSKLRVNHFTFQDRMLTNNCCLLITFSRINTYFYSTYIRIY